MERYKNSSRLLNKYFVILAFHTLVDQIRSIAILISYTCKLAFDIFRIVRNKRG